jgi:hypothetical protein
MIVEIVRCDKCGEAITGNQPVKRFVSDYFRFDLCPSCVLLLQEWLEARAADERPDEPEDEKQWPDVKRF